MIVISHHFSAVSNGAQYSESIDNRSFLPAFQACSLTWLLSELEELCIASCAGIIHLSDWCGLLENKELISDTDCTNCTASNWSSSDIYGWATFQAS